MTSGNSLWVRTKEEGRIPHGTSKPRGNDKITADSE